MVAGRRAGGRCRAGRIRGRGRRAADAGLRAAAPARRAGDVSRGNGGAAATGRGGALEPWAGTLDEQPLRLSWAVPGGPDADVAWPRTCSAERGIERRGPAVQVRSWNLSSIWRLPLADAGPAWLKVVPPFFGHEGDVLRRLQAGPVPRLLGHDGPRILMADIEGEDQYDAPLPVLERMVDLLVELQAAVVGRERSCWRCGCRTGAARR